MNAVTGAPSRYHYTKDPNTEEIKQKEPMAGWGGEYDGYAWKTDNQEPEPTDSVQTWNMIYNASK